MYNLSAHSDPILTLSPYNPKRVSWGYCSIHHLQVAQNLNWNPHQSQTVSGAENLFKICTAQKYWLEALDKQRATGKGHDMKKSKVVETMCVLSRFSPVWLFATP